MKEFTKGIIAELSSVHRELTCDECIKFGVQLFIDEYPLIFYAK